MCRTDKHPCVPFLFATFATRFRRKARGLKAPIDARVDNVFHVVEAVATPLRTNIFEYQYVFRTYTYDRSARYVPHKAMRSTTDKRCMHVCVSRYCMYAVVLSLISLPAATRFTVHVLDRTKWPLQCIPVKHRSVRRRASCTPPSSLLQSIPVHRLSLLSFPG